MVTRHELGILVAESAKNACYANAFRNLVIICLTCYCGLRAPFPLMPSTTRHLEPTRVGCNNLFIYQIMKQGRDEAGGDIAEEWMKNGWSGGRYMNRDWIVSIKRDIFPDGKSC